MNPLADSHFMIDNTCYNRRTGGMLQSSHNIQEGVSEYDSEDDHQDEYVIVSSDEGLNETPSMFGEAIAKAKYFVLSSYFTQN